MGSIPEEQSSGTIQSDTGRYFVQTTIRFSLFFGVSPAELLQMSFGA